MVSALVCTKSFRNVDLMRCSGSLPTTVTRDKNVYAFTLQGPRWLLALIVSLLTGEAAAPNLAAGLLDQPIPLTQALLLISSDRMLTDIRSLTAPAFKGRQTGTPDDLASAEFVEGRLDLHGERPPNAGSATLSDHLSGRSWLQSTTVRSTAIGDAPILHPLFASDSPPALIATDYLPILDSPPAEFQAPIVFVGYGISDPAGGIDEYAELDVRNKIVLFLRGKPERYGNQVSHADKMRTAREHGAIGLLIATGPILNAYETRRGITGRPSAFYGLTDPHESIPGAWISTSLAAAIVGFHQPDGTDRLRTLQQHINESLTPRSMAVDVTVAMHWTSTQQEGTLHNVISIVPGRDPVTQHETIVIGAHRDHFGQQGGLLFGGADDNASGTAVLLEVARVLAASPTRPKRSIALVSFSGEEQGLLGSKFYVTHPVVPLPSTIAMINVDHAGVGNGRLTIGLTGLDKSVAQAAGQTAGLIDHIDLFGFFPGGDHVPFKEAGVPTVTIVSGGIHPHFHQPTDTVDTLNPKILSAAARYVLALAWQLADAP